MREREREREEGWDLCDLRSIPQVNVAPRRRFISAWLVIVVCVDQLDTVLRQLNSPKNSSNYRTQTAHKIEHK